MLKAGSASGKPSQGDISTTNWSFWRGWAEEVKLHYFFDT